jgi:hypothetical protein
MPRGVYERKPKGAKAVAPAPTKKAPVKSKTKSTPAPSLRADKAAPVAHAQKSVPAADVELKAHNAAFLFNVLNNNVLTFSQAITQLGGQSSVSTLLTTELSETIGTITALRCDVFGDLLGAAQPQDKASAITLPEAEEEEETVDDRETGPAQRAAAPTPGAIPAPATMTLPQGSFTPPAPPTLPQH